jgi:hypothetical protein
MRLNESASETPALDRRAFQDATAYHLKKPTEFR